MLQSSTGVRQQGTRAMNDRQPASDPLSTMPHEHLRILEEVLAEKFDAAYEHARYEIATTGQVSPALRERLERTQALHEEVCDALQLDLLQDEANLGHARPE